MRSYWQENKKIKDLLTEIKALKIVYETVIPLPHIEENIRRESLLKSSLFSARVEGNPLTLSQVKALSGDETEENVKKREVSNLLSAYKFVYFKEIPLALTEEFIFKLHQLVMKSIADNAGRYRNVPWAIFNQAGVAVYLAPPFSEVPRLIKEMLEEINASSDPAPVKAAIVQFVFEKIHPFADGNGRVGRLLSAYILRKEDFHFRGLVSFEEYVDENRTLYYQALEEDNDMTNFVEFFLESMVFQARKTFKKLNEREEEQPEDGLLPRRREILEIIRDHVECSFDFLARRFPTINTKTLHYDLKQLQEKGFVQKLGTTRGSLYKAKK